MNTSGIINVYKEKDYTSFDVVARLRGILKIKKIGHTGTLDPDATGVLPICIGNATKVVDLLTDKQKTYQATFRFGLVTDTQDITGTIIRETKETVSFDIFKEKIMDFVGEYQQIPPMYSAVWHNGIRLYDLAREGIIVEREARNVCVHEITHLAQLTEHDFQFEITVSKGTYIRTLIFDLGEALGVGATLTELVRTSVAPFHIKDALKIDEIALLMEQNRLHEILLPPDSLFEHYPALIATKDLEKPLYNGNKLPISLIHDIEGNVGLEDKYRVYDTYKQFIGIYKVVEVEDTFALKVDKMFYP